MALILRERYRQARPPSCPRTGRTLLQPLLDIAVVTLWEQKDGHYRVAAIRALLGERLADPKATVPDQPAWMVADDPITTLARITAARLDTFRQTHPAKAQDIVGGDGVTFASAAANMRAALPRLLWNAGLRTQWTTETEPWLFPVLAQIDQALAARTTAALTAAAPDTDTTIADAIAGLPAAFAANLTLDMVLPAGNQKRLLIGSMPDDGDVYLFVLCRMEGTDCALRASCYRPYPDIQHRRNRHDRETTTLHHRRTVLHAAGEPVCDASANRGRAFGKVKATTPSLASVPLIKAIGDYTKGVLEEGTALVKEGLSGKVDAATYNRRADDFLDRKANMGVTAFLEDAADNLKLKVSNPLAGLKEKLGDTRLGRAAASVKEKIWATTVESGETSVAKSDKQYGAIDPRIALDINEEETEWYQAETDSWMKPR